MFQIQSVQEGKRNPKNDILFTDVSWISPYCHEQEVLMSIAGFGFLDPMQFCECKKLRCIHAWEKTYKKYITIDFSYTSVCFDERKSIQMTLTLSSKIRLFQQNLEKYFKNCQSKKGNEIFINGQTQCKNLLFKLQQLPDEDCEIEIHKWNLLMEDYPFVF